MNRRDALRLSDDSDLQGSAETETLVGDGGLAETVTRKSESLQGSWTIAACVICTIVNLVAIIWSPPSFTLASSPLSSITPNGGRLLRRPNQFMGLDKVSRPSPPQPTLLTNYPVVILPVDSAAPRKVFDHDPKRHSSPVGTITPEERRVVLTDTLSTVIQFRAMDFGMEKCEVNIHLPALSKLPFTPPSSIVSLYRLESKYVLDTSSLSYAKRPRRVSKLAEIGLHEADNVQWHSGKLECPSESVLTFELACSTSTGSSCNLEWWQDRIPEITSTDAAVFVTQYATL